MSSLRLRAYPKGFAAGDLDHVLAVARPLGGELGAVGGEHEAVGVTLFLEEAERRGSAEIENLGAVSRVIGQASAIWADGEGAVDRNIVKDVEHFPVVGDQPLAMVLYRVLGAGCLRCDRVALVGDLFRLHRLPRRPEQGRQHRQQPADGQQATPPVGGLGRIGDRHIRRLFRAHRHVCGGPPYPLRTTAAQDGGLFGGPAVVVDRHGGRVPAPVPIAEGVEQPSSCITLKAVLPKRSLWCWLARGATRCFRMPTS